MFHGLIPPTIQVQTPTTPRNPCQSQRSILITKKTIPKESSQCIPPTNNEDAANNKNPNRGKRVATQNLQEQPNAATDNGCTTTVERCKNIPRTLELW